jgi:hypothetical protein
MYDTESLQPAVQPAQLERMLNDPLLLDALDKFRQSALELTMKEQDHLHGISGPTAQGGAPLKRERKQRSKTMNAVTATVANAGRNGITLTDMLAVVDDLGKQAALGVDVQIKMDLKVLEAAFQGGLDLSASKHGADIDDATKLGEAYWKARNGAVIFDAKAGNQRKLISNMRKSIKLGMWSKGGPGEPLATVNNLITLRQKLRKDPAASKKLDDAHNTFMRFATAQLKRDNVIPDAELESFCFKSAKEEGTLEDFFEGTRKRAKKWTDKGSPEAAGVVAACTAALTAIAKAKGAVTP